MEAESRFRAMGTEVHVVVVGGTVELLEAARERIDDLESRWSRFRPTSEISLLNLLAGRSVRVSGETVGLVHRAIEGAWITRGLFDPTVLGDVVRAGYDRSFELIADGSADDGRSQLGTGYSRIAVDAGSSTIALPADVGFDPGGVGKGYAADLVVAELLSRGARGALVNVGGDLRAEGEAPGGGAWAVAIAHPFRPHPIVTVGLRGGAVATSMRTRRTWGPPGNRGHHLIDPRTGRPARTGLSSVTVVAAEGWFAEVSAKGAFMAGLDEGLRLIESIGAEGLVVDDAGVAHRSAGFDRFAQRADAPESVSSAGRARRR